MLRRLAVLILSAAAVLPAAASAEPVASLGAPSQVRELQGTLVFSRYDAGTREYRLAIRRPGVAPVDVPGVAPSDRTFNADIGLDSAGRDAIVFERCPETCDLFIVGLDGGPVRAIRNANDPERPDVAPTLWRGRIVWARIYGEQRDRKVIVYTKRLTAPRSTPSRRLPGVPARGTQGRSVDELELWGDNLAQRVSYECSGCPGTSTQELRLVRVATRQASRVAVQPVGLSGQQLVGLSFFDGWLGWYRTCHGDPSGCRGGFAGPWRMNLRTRSYARVPGGGPARVDGFVETPQREWRAEGCSFETAGDLNAGCRVEEDTPGFYEPARPPLG
jgi:hypothetical protein